MAIEGWHRAPSVESYAQESRAEGWPPSYVPVPAANIELGGQEQARAGKPGDTLPARLAHRFSVISRPGSPSSTSTPRFR